MKLVDLTVSKTFIGKPLEEGSWYLRLEMPDGLAAWKKAGKFSIEEGNKMLVDAEVDFFSVLGKFREALSSVVEAQVEEQPTLWLNDLGDLKMTARSLVKLPAEESIDEKVEAVKKLMKEQHEVYLRVRKV